MFDDLVQSQGGVVSRTQLLSAGFTAEAIRARVSSGRWQRVFLGVYATFSGPVPRPSLLWATALRAGEGAVLSHETAAELAGLADDASSLIHVSVPARRAVARTPGVVVHRCQYLDLRCHPTRTPSQTRIEETIIDLTQTARTLDDAMGWLARGVGSRLTTPPRLLAAMGRRSRVRWRPILLSTIADVDAGCHSLLELMFLRDVERAHGLPVGERQSRSPGRTGVTYDDVRYPRYRTRVELDGRAAHPEHRKWRDMRRDNKAVVAGDDPLRYGLADVDTSPCLATAQLAAVLQAGGWTGTPVRCRRHDCVIP